MFNRATGIDPGFGASIRFNTIPATATVLIVVTQSGMVTINTADFVDTGGAGGFTFSSNLTRRILWVFPNATRVDLVGGSQWRGSVLIPSGGALFSVPGINGRFIVSGNLEQNGAGSEFHNYDFIGDLPGPSAASLVFTKAFANNAGQITTFPSITVQAVCTTSGSRTTTFTPPATGTIGSLVAGETCTLTETAIRGGSLAGGYTFSAPGAAVFAPSSNPVLVAGNNAITVTNDVLGPAAASLVFTKAFANNAGQITTFPSITVQAVCTTSGTRTTTFMPPATGTIASLVAGETCTLTETAVTGGSLAGGYTFSAPGAAVFTPSSNPVLVAGNNAITVTNDVLGPAAASLVFTKAFANNAGQITTFPSITVQAVCTTSGTRTTTFTPPATGTIGSLVAGETCTLTETAITGGSLAGGFTFSAPGAAVFTPSSNPVLVAGNNAITVTNDVLFTAGGSELGVAKLGQVLSISDPGGYGNGGASATAQLAYVIVVRNYGTQPITALQIDENLITVFGTGNNWSVVSVTSPTLVIDPAYDGRATTGLLVGTDALAAGATATVRLQVSVQFTPGQEFVNQVVGSGLINATPVSDASNNGTDPAPGGNPGLANEPTRLVLGVQAIPAVGAPGLVLIAIGLLLLAGAALRRRTARYSPGV